MKRGFGRFFIITLLICCFSPALIRSEESHVHTNSRQQDYLKKFLQTYLNKSQLQDDRETRYYARFVDLNDDGTKEAIVYIIGRHRCGSGGCTTLVLLNEGSVYKLITKITLTRPPIRV